MNNSAVMGNTSFSNCHRIISTVILTVLASMVLLSQTRYDTFISATHQDSLDATYFYPTQLPPPSGYPVILFVHGFGLNKYSTIASCSTYALNKYVTITYSVRGHGNSQGLSTIMSVLEREDLAKVVDFIRQLPNVDTTMIGISGGSQGGLHGLWAAANGLPIRAVTSDVIVPHWASDMLMNGCIRRTVVLLLKSGGVQYDAIRDTLWDLARQDDYDKFKTEFTQGRDVDTSALSSSNVPILQFLKWQDYYFNAAGGIKAFNNYQGTKKIYIGTRGHFSDEAESERLYQHDQIFRWFREFLTEQSTGILTEPMYTYAYSGLPMDSLGYFTWTRLGVDSWPPSGIQPIKFYLGKDSTLLYSPPASGDWSFTLENKYLNPAYTFESGYLENFHGSSFDAALPKQTYVFRSQSITSDVYWIGAPKMKLYVESNTDKFPIHAQIYEEDSSGTRYFVNRINFTGRHWNPGTSDWIEVEGIQHAHKFTKGNRIRVELTNIDVTNRILYGKYPFVVPMFAQSNAIIYSDSLHPSYIEIPLIGSPTAVEPLANNIPEAYSIIENYPNPFNPTTVIRYRLSVNGWVTLKIYDLIGREIATLYNGKGTPGSYQILWDANTNANGIYICKILIQPSDGAIPIMAFRKMLLVR